MKITRFLALAAALAPALAIADLSPDNFRQLSSGGKLEKTSVEMYVGGVVKGYLNANGYLSATGQKPLFCYKGDIDTAQAHKIAAQSIKEHLAKSPGESKEEIVEMLIMMKLRAMYPC
jgi:hypothetical protein